jgi:hypothetical protein
MVVTIADVLNQWAALGIFDFVIPFLLIFAIVFGILSTMNVFKNRTIDGVIALAVGLLALQFGLVPQFFNEIFPRVGVGLIVILVIIITAGFFVDTSKGGVMYALLGIAAAITLFILVRTSDSLGWYSTYFFGDYIPLIIGLVIFLVIILAIIGSTKPKSEHEPYVLGTWERKAK